MAKKKTKAVSATLAQRQKTHGSFTDHSKSSQDLKKVLKQGKNWNNLSDVQKEALEMIVHKIARVLSGNPNEPDHWHDIGGYSALAENEANG